MEWGNVKCVISPTPSITKYNYKDWLHSNRFPEYLPAATGWLKDSPAQT